MTTTDLIAAIIRSCQFTVIGRVGQDPELKYFQSGTCKVQLSLAVNRPGAKKDDPNAQPPDWFKAEFWGPDAEAITNQIKKGDLLEVTGRISSDTWETRNGEKRTDLIIKVERWAPVARKDAPAPQGQPAAAAPAAGGWGGGAQGDDSDVPF